MINYQVGFDIGGTNIKAVLLKNGKIIKGYEVKTKKNANELKIALLRIEKKFSEISHEKFTVGVGVAGVVSGSQISFATNITFLNNFDFSGIFLNKLNLPIDNDARCFLKAEVYNNKLFENKKVFGFTVGTGVGRAFALNGIVLPIKKFEYPELWEKDYQNLRKQKKYNELSDFFVKKADIFLKEYKPDVIILGGGLCDNKSFFNKLEKGFLNAGFNNEVLKAKMGKYAGAVGAAVI